MDEPTTVPEPMLRYFMFSHLRHGTARDTSAMFSELAHQLCEQLPRTPERTVALRKLLESKDAAVRATFDAIHPA